MDINEFAKRKASQGLLRRNKAIIGKSQLLVDLGMNGQDIEMEKKVLDKIAELEKQFDLIMITEQFAESMILFQDLACWPMEDLTFVVQNERKQEKKSAITDEAR